MCAADIQMYQMHNYLYKKALSVRVCVCVCANIFLIVRFVKFEENQKLVLNYQVSQHHSQLARLSGLHELSRN
jgi:hypothetical protein